MEEVKTIKGSLCSKFSNSLHNGFHSRIWQYLRGLDDKTKIHLSDELMSEYGTNIAAEGELDREARAHINTEALLAADRERDKAVSYLFNMIDAAKEATIPETQQAGKALNIVVAPYRGIQNIAGDEETAAVKGCVNDLRKPANSQYVLTLNLGAAITAAADANQKYEDLQSERTDYWTANKKEPAKEVRRRTDANYTRICELIYASQLLCTVPEDLPVIEEVIDHINGIIKEYRTSYNRSQGQKDSGEDKPEEGGEQEQEPEPDDRPVVE